MKPIFACAILLVISQTVFAQLEKRDVRKGNKAYKAEQYEAAEISYLHGLDKNPESTKAQFNLGDALYKLNRQDQAEKTFGELSKADADSSQKAAVFHNLGNTQLQQKKWQESVHSYKQALRYRPFDMETKQNLAYAQMMLQNEQNQQNKDNQDQQDKNQQDKDEQNKDKNQDQNQNQDDKDNKDNQQQDKKEQDAQNQPEPKISKQDAQRMLEAVQADEKETQDKVKKEKAKVLQQQKIEKNW